MAFGKNRPEIQRPRVLVLLSGIYLVFPFIFAFACSRGVFHKPVFGLHGIFTLHFLLTTALISPFLICPFVAVGIYQVRPLGWYVFHSFNAFFMILNITLMALMPEYSVSFGMTIFGGLGVLTAMMFHSGIRSPYFNPTKRRWEQATRYRSPLNARVTCGEMIFESQTLDISMSGCFLGSDMAEYEIGAPLMMCFSREKRPIYAIGQMVWKSMDRANPGCGVRFLALDPKSRENLEELIDSLKDALIEEPRRVPNLTPVITHKPPSPKKLSS